MIERAVTSPPMTDEEPRARGTPLRLVSDWSPKARPGLKPPGELIDEYFAADDPSTVELERNLDLPGPITAPEVQKWIDMRKRGFAYDEIGRHFRRTDTTVMRVLTGQLAFGPNETRIDPVAAGISDRRRLPKAPRREVPRKPKPLPKAKTVDTKDFFEEKPGLDPLRPIDDDEILEWWVAYDKGRSIGKIATEFCRPPFAVHHHLNQLGVLKDQSRRESHEPSPPNPNPNFTKHFPGPPPADVLLRTAEGQAIFNALAKVNLLLESDRERPHMNEGVVSGSLPYAHNHKHHYCPMSSRQREMDRLAKPRRWWRQIRNELNYAGLLGGGRGSGTYGYWT